MNPGEGPGWPGPRDPESASDWTQSCQCNVTVGLGLQQPAGSESAGPGRAATPTGSPPQHWQPEPDSELVPTGKTLSNVTCNRVPLDSEPGQPSRSYGHELESKNGRTRHSESLAPLPKTQNLNDSDSHWQQPRSLRLGRTRTPPVACHSLARAPPGPPGPDRDPGPAGGPGQCPGAFRSSD